MKSDDFNRCFCMASFTAFLMIRDFTKSNSNIALSEAIKLLQKTNSDATYLDYQGGYLIYNQLNVDDSITIPVLIIRIIISELIILHSPWWLKLFPLGRERVKSALSQDQFQCFREAGLFEAVPSQDIIEWWDHLSSISRSNIDVIKMKQARRAEYLSLIHEQKRLKELGIKNEPIWVSLEDNKLGYDILSYDIQESLIIPKLVEVKSTTENSIFVTHNEWDNALGTLGKYSFYVWSFPEEILTEYSSLEIQPHIPSNNGNGKWQEVIINL